jgi:preprotein translocase subunit SecG
LGLSSLNYICGGVKRGDSPSFYLLFWASIIPAKVEVKPMLETEHPNHSKTGKTLKHNFQSGLWWIAIVLILAGGVYSQPPAPTPPKASSPPQKSTEKTQTNANQDQSNSNESSASMDSVKTIQGQANANQNAQDVQHETSDHGWTNILSATTAIATLFLVVVTAILAYYTYKLWNATVKLGEDARSTSTRQANEMVASLRLIGRQIHVMRNSLEETRNMVELNQQALKTTKQGIEIAQDNMIYAQRAYVAIASVEITSYAEATRATITRVGGDPSDEDPSRLRLKIENSGNTPANNVEVFHRLEATESPPIPSKDAPHWKQVGLIAPHSFVYHYGDWVGDHEIDWEVFDHEGAGIYCWGVLRYQDIFEQIRHTIFSYVQSPQVASLNSLPPFYPSDSGGNEAE